MPGKNISVHELLSRLRVYFQESSLTRKYSNEPPPLRAELYNTQQLARHGRSLAKTHKIKSGRARDFLIKRLTDNEKILLEVRNLVAEAIKEKTLITPGGEWLLDNFYLIEEQIRTGKRHYPKGYSEGLPKLQTGPSAGLPRVYDIALEIISHSDGRIDSENLTSFISAYQEVTPLDLGELWAIPIMLRLALIENLRRVSTRIALDRINQSLADYWSDEMIKTAEEDPKSLILVIADMARSGPPMESSFVAELTRQLMWKGPALTLPLTWMEQRLSESGMTSTELVNVENQKQAADQVSISNSIGSLRFIVSTEWRKFVESMSIVEQTLRKCDGAIYPQMDFSTRDHYRHVIERIAKYSKHTEAQVTQMVIRFTNENQAEHGATKRHTHIGYYLVDNGLAELERLAAVKLPLTERVGRRLRKWPLAIYMGGIFFVTLLLSAIALLDGYGNGLSTGMLFLIGILSILATSQLAITMVNWVVTLRVPPNLLPRMDFSDGIPATYKTLVVVPTLLTSKTGVEELIEALEVRFLANKDENLFYGLLTDFADANSETLPGDDILTDLAVKKIRELNKHYSNGKDIFFLFHRPRKWNAADKIWMGYERKRGKLTELNGLLTEGITAPFSIISGATESLKNVKYVITLDTDTQLPRESAWKLVATMAHPLNQPLFDERKQRVTEGYAILQPRVAVSLPRTSGSLYNQMHANDAGLDPYTRLTSDVYQDLFSEGSFIGKGIYDIKVFEQAIRNRFPDNRILSHDLLEGCYARSGLVSDVQLYEEYPSKYSSDVSRRHRWTRGDWQIGWWFLPIVPDINRKFSRNTLSALSRWKIFDNLRRSLVPIALLVILILGWTVFSSPVFYTLSVLAVLVFPSLVSAAWNALHVPKESEIRQHIISAAGLLGSSLLQNVYTLVCLPYEAYYTVDAILRTSWRMLVSRRHLLEWTPSSALERKKGIRLSNAFQTMWISPVLALLILIGLIAYYPSALFSAAPLIVLWLCAPVITWVVSRPPAPGKNLLNAAQVSFLRKIARKTWGFFERFVSQEDNWLPPDNYQEQPKEVVAHRTSPTNIGLSLLANLGAYDFGYIPVGTLLTRSANTLATMGKMERFKGHLYNWYDTQSLSPLPPKYISTVDSGNLAGHLLTLRQGIIALPDQPIVSARWFEGLLDTLSILEEQMRDEPLLREIRQYLQVIKDSPIPQLKATMSHLQWLVTPSARLLSDTGSKIDSDNRWWIERFNEQCVVLYEDLIFMAPWLLCVAKDLSEDVETLLDTMPTLSGLASLHESFLRLAGSKIEANTLKTELERAVALGSERARERIILIEELQHQCNELADMEYEFLYDRSKHLLAIGYNVDDHRRDNGFYDLLASEARLCNFVAIAQGKLPQECWFALGRLLTNVSGMPILLSWSGSMFEYLMPNLVMPEYENTLLYQTNKAVVQKQIEYGNQRGVPWGVSESGYNMVDASLNYQYRAFGVPGLGLKRGLSDDLVIAPYASLMSLMVSPYEACVNLKRLSDEGYTGKYGFYEAIDYTPARSQRGQFGSLIQSFMAHHQGMGFLSLAYLLLDQPMQKRFEAELQFQATLLLLQERIPKASIPYSHNSDTDEITFPENNVQMRVISTPNTPTPEIQLLSNGRFHSMLTNAGGGYSKWKNIALTRWREDATCDNRGIFCYIRDLESNTFWSNAYQPTLKQPKNYVTTFTQGRVEIRRQDNGIETYTEVVVSPEDDVELRRIHVTNRSRKRRIIEITSYAEVVLNNEAADAVHPAFSNLFVQTEIAENQHAIICTRRPRSVNEHTPWLCHVMKMTGAKHEEVSYETDRMQFIGRGNSTINPRVMAEIGKLSGNDGSVLDPIVSIRYKVSIEPGQKVVLDMIMGISDTREGCEALVNKYQDRHHTDRVLELAWTHSQVVLRQINATEEDTQLYNRVAGSVVFMNPLLRAEPNILVNNHKGQSGLWSYSISGDLPIVLLKIKDQSNISLVKQMIQAHTYWRLKGLSVDLVIWNEDYGGYRQNLYDQISGLIAAGSAASLSDSPGSIYVRNGEQIPQEDRTLFQTVARVIISDDKGTLLQQVNRKNTARVPIPLFVASESVDTYTNPPAPVPDLQFFNGKGGFSKNGEEYIIITKNNEPTPAPWVNVIANPNFGTIVSETGQAYTWVRNAHEQRLTPWNNDPVCDSSGEQFYIRDEDSAVVWSPAPKPANTNIPYLTKHGFGYTIFEHSENGIWSEMCVFVDLEKTVKFTTIRLRNDSGKVRDLSVTGYTEWVLGDLRPKSVMHITTSVDSVTGALTAKNPYSAEFGNQVAFFDVNDSTRSFTADRTEFIGRNGTLESPEALTRIKLSNRSGAGLDACAALQVVISLVPGQEQEVVFCLGAAQSDYDVTQLVSQFRMEGAVNNALDKVKNYWRDTLTSIQIETPDAALNTITNGWLMYQTLACRLWARSGYYQSGGAFGFRDQLQDAIAITYSQPALARGQILLCASRQFKEGDVQHWWHPPTGRGVRTTCSDDYLWLAYVTSRYVQHTGDIAILNEKAHFLEGRRLNPDEESYYDLPNKSPDEADLYTHCMLAINNGINYGSNGLPLIGSGDWNDGMDKVGRHGKGESVWLAFFLYDVLQKFVSVAALRKDHSFANFCLDEAAKLKTNINRNAWDGGWYRRAYFDDGTPLGSATNPECSIDSISQSWSVLSGAGTAERCAIAMEALDKRLVDRQNKLIQLLDPPFDNSDMNPGYIKGYVPGVRENGGQYSHAAIWTIMAFAALGDTERTWELMQMINPINHAMSPEGVDIYKVEPYVMAADVYKVPAHLGRGGWTWYTGSAGWMYQAILQSLLGLSVENDKMYIKPCAPASWPSYSIRYKYKSTTYSIKVIFASSIQKPSIFIDGKGLVTEYISLTNDGSNHNVECVVI